MENYYKEIAKGLNETSWGILRFLRKIEDASYKDIKEKFKFSHGKLEKEIARLEGAVLIKTIRNSEDMRFLKYIITKHGQEVIKLEDIYYSGI